MPQNWPPPKDFTKPRPFRHEILYEAPGQLMWSLEREKPPGEDEDCYHVVVTAQDRPVDLGEVSMRSWAEKVGMGAPAGNREGQRKIGPAAEVIWKVHTQEVSGMPRGIPTLALRLLAITDGGSSDTPAFAQSLLGVMGKNSAVLLVMGYGDSHKQAVRAYQAVAGRNPRVRVVALSGVEDPDEIVEVALAALQQSGS